MLNFFNFLYHHETSPHMYSHYNAICHAMMQPRLE